MPPLQTYLFYDTETTGLNESFDQILHFAAIRTDTELKELERYELKIKLNPDVVPSPYAMITHRMSFDEINAGVSEYEAAKKIHQWVNQPGTISLGYNTLDFDDKFLRFLFYRNLLLPYTHQFKNNCGRMDIYPMTVMYYLFKNSCLEWPEKNNRLSLKLEDLNTANQFMTGRSHHAMFDVEVTLALAKKLKQEQEMWQYAANYFNKQEDEKRTQPLQKNTALIVHSKLGFDKRYQTPAVFIGQRSHYRQSLWLQLDHESLSQSTLENITDFKYVSFKKFGEPPFVLPERFLQQLNIDRLTLAEENKKWLLHHSEIFKKLVQYQENYRYPTYPDIDVDASLYLGFWNYEEENICRAFHAASPKEKVLLTEKIKNPRLKELATRLLGRHFREYLTPAQEVNFSAYLSKEAVIDYQGKPRLTKATALNEISELSNNQTMDKQQIEILNDLKKLF